MTPIHDPDFATHNPDRYRYIGGMDGHDLWVQHSEKHQSCWIRIVSSSADDGWAGYAWHHGLVGLDKGDNTNSDPALLLWIKENQPKVEQYLRLFAPELVEH